MSSAIDVGLGQMVNQIDAKLIPEEDMKALLKAGSEKLSIPVGLGIMNASKSSAQQKLSDAATAKLMAMAMEKATSVVANAPRTFSLTLS